MTNKQAYGPMGFAEFKNLVNNAKGSCDKLQSLESKLSRIYDDSDAAQMYLRKMQRESGCKRAAEMQNIKKYLIKAADMCDENNLINIVAHVHRPRPIENIDIHLGGHGVVFHA